jgi:DNA-binding MarR family transcriptional regulator
MPLLNEDNSIQKELVRHYYPDNGTIARAMKKPVDTGYVKKITNLGNPRAVQFFLTKKGGRVIPTLHAVNRESEEMVCIGLTPEEISRLLEFLHRLARNSVTIMENAVNDENE